LKLQCIARKYLRTGRILATFLIGGFYENIKMNVSEILKSNPELAENLTLKISAAELAVFADICFQKGREDKPHYPPPEEYLTPAQFADLLKISLVTLWNWDKKSITKPVRIGNAKRYRRSDLEKILKS